MTKKEITAEYSEIIIFSLYLFAFLLVFLCLPFFILYVNNYNYQLKDIINFKEYSFLYVVMKIGRLSLHLILIYLLGAIIHELLHILPISIYLRKIKNVFTAGIAPGGVAFYIHCKKPIPLKIYKISLLLPLIIMGIIPVIFGFLFINLPIFALGIIFIWAASGDIYIFYLLRNIQPKAKIIDHSEKVGCYVLSEIN